MTINIIHLYYDILNLYGESGNIKAIKSYLEKQNIKVNIKLISIDDEINLENVDLIYIGCGTENNLKLILPHFIKYKEEVKNFIKMKKFVISTGNSIELFGKMVGKDKALGIFDYTSKKTDIRIVNEVLFRTNFIKNNIIGFQNQGSNINNIKENNLFDVIKTSNCSLDKHEGYTYNNFYGSYLIGPLLVRNPDLLVYIINKLIKEKDSNFEIKKINLSFEEKSYKNFTNMYYNDNR